MEFEDVSPLIGHSIQRVLVALMLVIEKGHSFTVNTLTYTSIHILDKEDKKKTCRRSSNSNSNSNSRIVVRELQKLNLMSREA